MTLVTLTDDNFETTVTEGGITVVDCWAPWCGPCRTFAPIFEKVAASTDDVTFGKLNTEDHQQIAAALGITSIPTIMIFRDGIMVHRQSGVMPASELTGLIGQARNLDMDAVRAEMKQRTQEPPKTQRFDA